MRIAVKPLDDKQALAALYAAPEFSVVAHDHRPVGPISHPAVSYLGAYVDDVLAGCFLLIKASSLEIDLHALILRRFVRQSRDLGRLCIAHAFEQPGIARVTAYVIEGLESARNFTERLGFKQEGFRRDACMKSGALLGVHVMGLTRTEWEAI